MNENNNEKLSLSDLSNGAIPAASPTGMPVAKPKLDTSNVIAADIRNAVRPDEPNEVAGTNPIIDAAFASIEPTIARLNDESAALVEQGEMQRIEAEFAGEDEDGILDGDDDTGAQVDNGVPAPNIIVNNEEPKKSNRINVKGMDLEEVAREAAKPQPPIEATIIDKSDVVEETATVDVSDDTDAIFDGVSDEDMKFLDEDDESGDETSEEEEDDDEKTKEIMATIREEMSTNFKPVNNKLDLSSFSISKKPIVATKVISEIKHNPIQCADSVLFHEKTAVRMSSWKPMEIQSLDPARVRNGVVTMNNFVRNRLELIYEHIINENKPKSFEAWARLTPNTVIDDYMFAAYKATFSNANIITYTCNDQDCSNVWLENVPVNDMIKFENDAIKNEYNDILLNGVTDTVKATYDVTMFQVSDDYVFTMKTPSVYNTFIEPTLIDNEFSNKYSDLLMLISYIDGAYKIDRERQTLIPIDMKPTADKVVTYKRKVKTIATIIRNLTSDQIQALTVETDKYDNGKIDDEGRLKRDDISYIIPSRRCPKCGKKISETEMSPDTMLFTRHQLGLMKKI